MATFENMQLSDEIKKSLGGLGYSEATEVQEQVIPKILEGSDVLVQSKTGSGKTASFGIPICESVDWNENKPQVLILTPTRELALQIQEEISNIGRFKRIKAAAVFGKHPFREQVRELKQKTHVVVGTPGRVADHLERGTLSLEKVKMVVLDEADEMLKMGFINLVEEILDECPRRRQTMLFSATLPERIKKLSEKFMHAPISIEIKSEFKTTDLVDQVLYEVREQEKYRLLIDVLTVECPERCMIFCCTKEAVDALHRGLSNDDFACEKLHGGLEQRDRFETMKNFKLGKFQFLVSTDVAARGIDVSNVTHVVNYDIPQEKDAFVHRIGRAGRAGAKGRAITFMNPFEKRFLKDIQSYIGYELPIGIRPTEEEVENAKPAFEKQLSMKPKVQKQKTADVNKEIMKIYVNGGKKKKLRAVDFVGAITSIEGVCGDDIGIIDIQDNVTYIDILNGKGWAVIDGLKQKTIKGKNLKVQKAYR